MKTVCTSNGLTSDQNDRSYRLASLGDIDPFDPLIDLSYENDQAYDDYLSFLVREQQEEASRLDDVYAQEEYDKWYDDDRYYYELDYRPDPSDYQFHN